LGKKKYNRTPVIYEHTIPEYVNGSRGIARGRAYVTIVVTIGSERVRIIAY